MLPHLDSTRLPAVSDSARAWGPTLGLLAVTARLAARPATVTTFVTTIDPTGVERTSREARALAARGTGPVTVELAYVSTPGTESVLAPLLVLESEGIVVERRRLGRLPPRREVAAASAPQATAPPIPCDGTTAPDPFGLDPAFHERWLPLLRFFEERYWRIVVQGLDHVPRRGPVLLAANHSGAVPADAAMLAAVLARRHPAHRRLRVLYDRFVDDLPWIAACYRRFGGVPASLANAERLLARGEAVGLFPEGLHGLEKPWRERHQLRPFKSGTARLALRTGSPIVPVAIVGAEEAYPVVARLYRIGRLVGVPWIPVTPLFPLCGLAGAVPLPTKWRMRFCAPILPPPGASDRDEDAVRALTARVHSAVADALAETLAARGGFFL
jgi:1-acyl-sn-glycerol-3-phosphate acyltransferase